MSDKLFGIDVSKSVRRRDIDTDYSEDLSNDNNKHRKINAKKSMELDEDKSLVDEKEAISQSKVVFEKNDYDRNPDFDIKENENSIDMSFDTK